MPRKLIIDADPGIGDAFAIALAALDPGLELVGVTAVPGCVAGAVATRNILAVMESVDPDRRPRFGASSGMRPSIASDDRPSHGTFDPIRLTGDYGLGTSELPFAELHHPRESARLMVDLVRAHPHEITLLTLGPLTNVAIACELASDFLDNLQRLVILGGAFQKGGNVTAAAEFNMYVDPESARSVLRSSTMRTLLPLDVVTQPVLTFEHFDRLRQNRPLALRWFFDELLPFSLRAHHEQLGLESLPLQEVTALAFVAEPRHFHTRSLALDIELEGSLTRGATIPDYRRTGHSSCRVDVADTVDAQGVLDYLAQVIRSAV